MSSDISLRKANLVEMTTRRDYIYWIWPVYKCFILPPLSAGWFDERWHCRCADYKAPKKNAFHHGWFGRYALVNSVNNPRETRIVHAADASASAIYFLWILARPIRRPPSGRKDLALTYCTFPLSTLSLLVRALYDVYIEGAHIYTDCWIKKLW